MYFFISKWKGPIFIIKHLFSENVQASNNADIPEENGPHDLGGAGHSSERSRRDTGWPSGSRNNSLPTQAEAHEEEESKFGNKKTVYLDVYIVPTLVLLQYQS